MGYNSRVLNKKFNHTFQRPSKFFYNNWLLIILSLLLLLLLLFWGGVKSICAWLLLLALCSGINPEELRVYLICYTIFWACYFPYSIALFSFIFIQFFFIEIIVTYKVNYSWVDIQYFRTNPSTNVSRVHSIPRLPVPPAC